MAPYGIVPAEPPFPTPSNFPFQVVSGSHTSNWIAGLVTATTLQKGGISLSVAAPGGVNDGPVTSRTDSIFVSASCTDSSPPHDSATAGVAIIISREDAATNSAGSTNNIALRFTMDPPILSLKKSRRLYHRVLDTR